MAARRWKPACVFAGATAMALAAAWPLARDPARLTFVNQDVYGSAWLFAWAVRQAATAPLGLLEPNIFHPGRRVLGLTETFVPQALQAAPVLLLGGSPILAFNLVFIATFALSTLGAYLLARDVSGNEAAAWLAGVAYGFSAFRLSEIVHVQALSTQWLPFMLWALRRAARGGGRRWSLWTAVFAVLQGLSSGYYAIALAIALIVIVPFELSRGSLTAESAEKSRRAQRTTGIRCRRLRSLLSSARSAVKRPWRSIAIALGIAGVVIAVGLLPYPLARREEERIRGFSLSRPIDDAAAGSAMWTSFLQPGPHGGAPHQDALARALPPVTPLFPGLVIGGLAVVGILRGRKEEVRPAAALAVTGGLLALGPWMTLGPWTVPGLYHLLRPAGVAGMLRAPSRFAILFTLGVALLAALGAAALASRWRRAPMILVLFAIAEAFPVGLSPLVRAAAPCPPTAEWLARAPRGVVLELPWDHDTQHEAGLYAYWSTCHWQKLVNGWGGFRVERSFALGVIGRHFPEGWPTREMRRAGVRYVVVHMEPMTARQQRAMMSSDPLPAGVLLVADFGLHRVYEIDPGGPLEKPASPGTAR